MKIIFNLMNCGLGPNGGSSTIVKSANMLQKLGNEVTIIDTGKNQHTWTKLEVPHIITKSFNNVPDADVVIATGYDTVRSTVRLPRRCGAKVHWIRGYETWNMKEIDILNQIFKAPTHKIVNGIGLQKLIKVRAGIDVPIIYPGYDLDDFTQIKIRNKIGDLLILGGLYNQGTKRRDKRTKWIFDAVEILRNKYRIQLWMFGDDPMPNNPLIDKYFQKPDMQTKNTFYNHINLWLAPTENEGLTMPPAEAMLTGCPVVATNAPLCGMHDYMIDKGTGLVSNNRFESFLEKIEILLKNKDQLFTYGSDCRSTIFKIGSRHNNMKKMVEYLETIKDK